MKNIISCVIILIATHSLSALEVKQEEGCPCGVGIVEPGSYRCVVEKRQRCMFSHEAKMYQWYATNEYCHEDDTRCR